MHSSVTELTPSNWLLGFFKNLFGRRAQPPPLEPPPPAASAEPSSAAPPTEPAPAPTPTLPQPAPNEAASAGECVSVPLQPIINRLPEGLRARVCRSAVSGVHIRVPRDTVLAQLPKGAVRISFGELRQAAPPGVFSAATGDDQALVELPLRDLLACVGSDPWQRRTTQRRLAVPDDIAPLFGPAGLPRAAAPAPQPRVENPPSSPVPPRPAPPATASAALPQARPLSVAATSTTSEPAGAAEGRLVVPLSALTQTWPASVQAELTLLAAADAALAVPLGIAEEGLKRGKLTVTWQQVRAWLQPAPASAASTALADDLPLQLPLPTVAPLFFALRTAASPQRKITLPENIPGLFSGPGPASETQVPAQQVASSVPPSPPATATGPARPAAPALQLRSASAPAPASRMPAPATAAPAAAAVDFLAQLDQRTFTPVELAQKIAALPGVAGALLALPEGLLVAGQWPEGRDADAAAGFVPQMFARNAQYLRAFGMSEPRQLTVAVDGVPLALFKTPKIYLAVLGRAGQTLPERELAAAAAHLAR